MEPGRQKDTFNLNELTDLLEVFQQLKTDHPLVDEMDLIAALTHLSGIENPPAEKGKIWQAVMGILKINPGMEI